MAQNRAIGKDDKLLWHIPEDFKHFKRTTMGKPMAMGRKTFDSLPGALKGRTHIVISRSAPVTEDTQASLQYVASIDEAITRATLIAERDELDEAFIIGGGEIYKQTLSIIDRIYLTIVDGEYEGDTFFPEFDWNMWNITFEEKHEATGSTPGFKFVTLDKKEF